jgi:hypothetical protein
MIPGPPKTQPPAGRPGVIKTHHQDDRPLQVNPLNILLQRLEGAQRSSAGYRARCPACGGRTRKLSLSEGQDGRILLHCFGGCAAIEIVQALGLTLADLFPVRLKPQTPEQRRAIRQWARQTQWSAALQVLSLEARIVLIAARQLARWHYLSEDDDARLADAVERIDHCAGTLTEWRR